MKTQVLLGDEAVALGAVHAGISAAYAYPGTPSTEIVESLLEYNKKHGGLNAAWMANEKTAFEAALGASMVGQRALVAMKHVGLNVAADPFMNGAIIAIHGGLVVAVADDPGMHSSQNEQDSRYFADFGRVPCFEPRDQQEAYEMTREAFELSETIQRPVMLRLVTRLAHSRAVVELGDAIPRRSVNKTAKPEGWTLLPVNARRQWQELLDQEPEILQRVENSRWNQLKLEAEDDGWGVITTGIAKNYFLEQIEELETRPSHLHIGAYPLPTKLLRKLARNTKRILVIEEGYPYLERHLTGVLEPGIEIRGKLSGALPAAGELTPDTVRAALGLEERPRLKIPELPVVGRPPQLCSGCPHGNMFDALRLATEGMPKSVVASDIGCYTLGALPPYSAIESCVCMGASIGMAHGASAAGYKPAIAVIGDSTFTHSGVTPLLDAVTQDADMTLLILDNSAVAMTGGQETLLESDRLVKLVEGCGVAAEHLHVVPAKPQLTQDHAELLRREMEHPGLSVIIAQRECIEMVKHRKALEKAGDKS